MKKDSISDMSQEEKVAYMKLCAERIKYAAETKLSLLNNISEETDSHVVTMILRDLQKFEYAHIALYEN